MYQNITYLAFNNSVDILIALTILPFFISVLNRGESATFQILFLWLRIVWKFHTAANKTPEIWNQNQNNAFFNTFCMGK